jgi:DNA-binding response OmpR family regulator
MARVQAHLRRFGGQSAVRHSLSCGALFADTEKRRVFLDGKELELTSREYQILVLLMSRPQKIFTRDEIMDGVDAGTESFDRSIDAHIKNLRQKIGDDAKSPRYIHTVYGMGYRFAGTVRQA